MQSAYSLTPSDWFYQIGTLETVKLWKLFVLDNTWLVDLEIMAIIPRARGLDLLHQMQFSVISTLAEMQSEYSTTTADWVYLIGTLFVVDDSWFHKTVCKQMISR